MSSASLRISSARAARVLRPKDPAKHLTPRAVSIAAPEPSSTCPVHLATTPDQLSRKRSIGMNTPDRNSRPANSRTVLVLDDDVLVRMPVVQFLRDCGYRVVEAATIDEAIALLEKTNIPLDVVLSKIDIPGSMNGFGFAQWARSVRPELKILLAATPERTVRNAAELCEVGPTLKRPYDHKLVLDRIKRLLAARAQQDRS
jgi:response regulator RpfG family c-di-GMP phosphodiesterase